jgi:transcriptional regulator with XRE-family HTH domain
MTLQDRLKIWRNHLRQSQVDFSKSIKMPLRTYQSYESGERHPGNKALSSIAETGVNLHWLLTGTGPITHNEQTESTSSIDQQDDPLAKIRQYLDAMDAEKREQTVNELFARVQEIQRIEEMEKTILELKQHHKTGS